MHSLSAQVRTLALFSRAHGLLMLLAAAVALGSGSAWPAAVLGMTSLIACVLLQRGRWTPSGGFGAGNALTLVRLAMIAALPALGAPAPGPAAALLVLGVFALDGADGWLARRRGEAAPFGAWLDLESDALLVLLCALVLYQHGRLGAYVLLPGLLRYLFVLLLMLLPAAADAAPRSRLGRYTFSALIVAFAASLWPLEPVHAPFAAAVTALVVASFMVSIASAIRQGRGPVG
jgi:phosphatidylglycerophosphate synthase